MGEKRQLSTVRRLNGELRRGGGLRIGRPLYAPQLEPKILK